MKEASTHNGPTPRLQGFLSDHTSSEKVVKITTEPNPIYIEEARDSNKLNFDFTIKGLTTKKLGIRFIKAAVYDEEDTLVTFRHVNHNAVGTAGIDTIGKHELDGVETLDIFNPFHSYPKSIPLHRIRYMFTLRDEETGKEYYYGDINVHPTKYQQKVKLTLPVKGTLTILDGHDYYSHHRRFSMNLVRTITDNRFWSNFSRYSIDLTHLGEDGNTRKMKKDEYKENYDFHFKDITGFYTHGAEVYAPADGIVVDVVDRHDDLYDSRFDFEQAIEEDRVKDLAGNYVAIKHNDSEYSHLFHLLKGSVEVKMGDSVKRDQWIARVGFSGASTTYSHLHYQLLDGADFLKANALPCRFSDIQLLEGDKLTRYSLASVDTGDIIITE